MKRFALPPPRVVTVTGARCPHKTPQGFPCRLAKGHEKQGVKHRIAYGGKVLP